MSSEQNWDCSRAGKELDAFVRGDLPLEEIDRMRLHLEHCSHCSDVARFEEAFRKRLGELGRDTCCPDALRKRVEALLSSDQPEPGKE